MKKLILLIMLVAGSCGHPAPKAVAHSPKKNNDDSIHRADSVQMTKFVAKADSLTKRRDTLEKKFDQVTDLCSCKTWCHKNFWGQYWIRDHCLVCGIDSLGQLFMVADTYESGANDVSDMYASADIFVQINDTVYRTDRTKKTYSSFCNDKTANVQPTYICACLPVELAFFDGTDNGILQQIAAHPNDKIIFWFSKDGKKISPEFRLVARYRRGIMESVELAGILFKINSFTVRNPHLNL